MGSSFTETADALHRCSIRVRKAYRNERQHRRPELDRFGQHACRSESPLLAPVGLAVAAAPQTVKEKGRSKMSTGNLIFLLVLVGGVFAMFSMHRGGGHSHGMGGGCGGGHGHGSSDSHGSPDDSHEEEKKPLLDKPDAHAHAHDHEPVTERGKRRGY